MIHILTIHFNTDRWLDLQLQYIKAHVHGYKTWMYYEGFEGTAHEGKYYFCKEYSCKKKYKRIELDHIEKLNSLTSLVLSHRDTKDGDLLMWLDSDSFPIRDLNQYIEEKLRTYPLLAIQRPENGGDLIPHPSFTCCSVDFWKRNKLSWDGCRPQNKLCPNGLHDPGGSIYRTLTETNTPWYKLRRTRSLTKHKVFFTIYDSIIYHHGAGSRLDKGGKASCRGGDFGAVYNEQQIFNRLQTFANT
jgi:hypothetical protein